jgi:hypothetical protein
MLFDKRTKKEAIIAMIAIISIFAVVTYCAMAVSPRSIMAQGKLMAEAQAQATACKIVDVYAAPRMTITYKRPPDEFEVKVERRMETTSKPNLVWAAHPTTPTLPAQTLVYVDKATAQNMAEDVTYHYRFMTVNDKGEGNGVWSDPVCQTIKRPLPQTPTVVMM